MHRTLLLLLVATSCRASQPAATTSRRPDYTPVRTQPAPPTAVLYADCLGDAVAHRRYGHAKDASTSLLLFTCTGAPAQAFFEGLAAWSAAIGSQFEHAGRTYRSTARVRENLFGVDYCATDGAEHECVITLNVGDFVR